MSLWIYNDVELEVDLEDVDFQKRYESAFKKMEAEEKKLQGAGALSEITERYCMMFRNLFDDLFGNGTSNKLLGDKLHVGKSEDCYASFLDFASNQVKEINEKRALCYGKKYTVKKRR